MALFNRSAVKPVANAESNLKNGGFILKLASITKTEDEVTLSGVAESDSLVSEAGKEISVVMPMRDFQFSLGHNMARSLRDGLKRAPEWHAGTEVILAGCYEKDGRVMAKRGAVGTYVVAGEVDSERVVASAVVGNPVVELFDGDDKAVLTMRNVGEDAGDLFVRTVKKGGRAEANLIQVDAVVEALRAKVAEQEQINARILARQGFEHPVLRVSMSVYSPKDAFKVETSSDLRAQQSNVMLVAENGKSSKFIFNGLSDDARTKVLESVDKFLEANGEARAIPYVRIDYNKQKAVELATAYANLLDSRTQNLDSVARWQSHEKVLYGFNNLKGQFTPANLIMESFTSTDEKTQAKTTRHSLERVMPAANTSTDVMPGIEFRGQPASAPTQSADDDMDGIDVASLGGTSSDVDVALADVLGEPVAAADPGAARRPRSTGLGM